MLKRIVVLAAAATALGVFAGVPVAGAEDSSARATGFHTTLGEFEAHEAGGKWDTLSGELRSTKGPCVSKRRSITIKPFVKGPTVHFKSFGGDRAGGFRVHLGHGPYWSANQAFKVTVAPVSVTGGVCLKLETTLAPTGHPAG